MTVFRAARREDVPAIVALLRDDVLGATRESEDLTPYLEAFDRLQDAGLHHLIVGESDGAVVATYQLTILDGLSLKAARRGQIEGVRVAASHRGRGIGAAMMADAEDRARAAGCRLLQFTTNSSRTRAHAFYARLRYVPSHIGFKRVLD